MQSQTIQCPPALLRAGTELLLDIQSQTGRNGCLGRVEMIGHWARHYIGNARHYYRRMLVANLTQGQLIELATRRPFFERTESQDGLLLFRHPDGTCLFLWYLTRDDLQELAA